MHENYMAEAGIGLVHWCWQVFFKCSAMGYFITTSNKNFKFLSHC